MKKKIASIACLLLFAAFQLNAQDWDKSFPEINFNRLLEFEQHYADSIDTDPTAKKYYARVARYRFSGTFTGEKREVDPKVLASMKRVYKLFVGNPKELDELVKTEYGFEIGNTLMWMPIQQTLEKSLKKELKRGSNAKLYCLYLNEHGLKRQLNNTFLISEFKKEK